MKQQPLGEGAVSVGNDPAVKLQVTNLTKFYGAVPALVDATITLREGEFFSLLGPSGSGKTTLLMVVAGLLQPTRGEILIDGRVATFAPPQQRDLGMVFQNYALFPHLTVYENVAFPLRMRRVPMQTVRAEVARALKVVQLGQLADRYPRQLSGGQQQRIALARCIVYRPSIILMDEPLGALDRKLRDQMQLEIKYLHLELGITVLYVTHDQDEAMTMSDRICVMNNGKIEQVGKPRDLYFNPASLFVAEFLGESNILDCTVLEAAPESLARLRDGNLIRARSHGGIAVGGDAKCLVRPENLRILGDGESPENVLEAVVKDTLFIGGVSRCYLSLADGSGLVVKELSQFVNRWPEAGRSVRVGWETDGAVLLPSAEA